MTCLQLQRQQERVSAATLWMRL